MIQKLEGEEVSLTLTPEELAEADGVPADFKKPGFKSSIVDTLDYSAMTEAGCDDMVDIDELNSATLLYNLANRYKREEMEIYTWVGPILLALNPFKACPHYEGKEFEDLYRRITDVNFSPVAVKKELRPHTNAISAMAYAKLKSD
jgi:myosin heavy subunit